MSSVFSKFFEKFSIFLGKIAITFPKKATLNPSFCERMFFCIFFDCFSPVFPKTQFAVFPYFSRGLEVLYANFCSLLYHSPLFSQKNGKLWLKIPKLNAVFYAVVAHPYFFRSKPLKGSKVASPSPRCRGKFRIRNAPLSIPLYIRNAYTQGRSPLACLGARTAYNRNFRRVDCVRSPPPNDRTRWK